MSVDETGEDTCPVCGQEYVYKRGDVAWRTKTLRRDYAECVVEYETSSDPDDVFVHDTQRTVVNRVERGSPSERLGITQKLFGGDPLE